MASTASIRSLIPSAWSRAIISRATARAAVSLRPSSRQWPSDTSSGRPREIASASAPARGTGPADFNRQRLARQQLAIARDGQRVVIEVDAVHVVR